MPVELRHDACNESARMTDTRKWKTFDDALTRLTGVTDGQTDKKTDV